MTGFSLFRSCLDNDLKGGIYSPLRLLILWLRPYGKGGFGVKGKRRALEEGQWAFVEGQRALYGILTAHNPQTRVLGQGGVVWFEGSVPITCLTHFLLRKKKKTSLTSYSLRPIITESFAKKKCPKITESFHFSIQY